MIMGKKKIIIFCIVCIIIIVASLAFYFNPSFDKPLQQSQPSLSENDYVVYKQVYSWIGLNGSESITRYVYWNITSKQENIANLQIRYSWYNGSMVNLTFPETISNIAVDMNTREIIDNQSNKLPFGSIFPYWISPSVKEGDHINTSNGQARVYQAQETVKVLNSRVDCWLLSFAVQGNDGYAIYDRFYDKVTGICVENRVDIVLNGTPINFDETIERTNISSGHGIFH
jgi:hypothetical protein